MSDERSQAVPEERGQQLRDQRAAAGGHPERHGHDARPALKVIQAGLVGRQGRHEGHQGKKAITDGNIATIYILWLEQEFVNL